MVLINNLTIDEINAAFIALQRSRTEIVGGEKGNTVNNISITNKGGRTGTDWSTVIQTIQSRLSQMQTDNDRQDEEITDIRSILEGLAETVGLLADNGVSGINFDENSRRLSIFMQDGNSYDTLIPTERVRLEFDENTNTLTLYMGNQRAEVTLPSMTQVQADWEQSDPTAVDYIKNKIPIWIADGSADDNMTPIDSVTSGSMRPVTSNAVYDETNKNKFLIPSPAGTTKYYKLTNNSTTKIGNVYIGNRYFCQILVRPSEASATTDILRLNNYDTDYSIKACKMGTDSNNKGVFFIKIGNYNPTTIINLDNSDITLENITETDWNNATSSTLTNYREYLDITTAPTIAPTNVVGANNLNVITSGGVYNLINATTPSFDCPRGGTYTLNYLTKQKIGNVALYLGRVTIGSNASGGSMYLQVDGVRGSTHNICNSQWCIHGTSYEGVLYSAYGSGNASLWLRIGSTSTNLQTSEGAGQSIDFSFMAIPYSA